MQAVLDIHSEVADALAQGRPVVALESTLIAQGLPRPLNGQTARQAEEAVRAAGAIPATICVWQGRPTVGLTAAQLEELASRDGVRKASRRDLAVAVARGHTAATTVAATMHLAYLAGIRVFATGGIGGAHRGDTDWDISADLVELARTPVAVVCAGAKSILDLPRTLEILETLGVPVVGHETDEFPAFYVRSSRERLAARVDTPAEAARLLQAHWQLGGGGVVLAQPLPVEEALDPVAFEAALQLAEAQAQRQGIRGPALTPFLLAQLAKLTDGQTLKANHSLVLANAALAAQVSVCYACLVPR